MVILELLVRIFSFIFLVGGALFVMVGGIGMLRLPDIYNRMSATTKAATFGVGLMLIGASIFFYDEIGAISRAFAILLFLFATAPVAAHMIGRAAYSDGVPLAPSTSINDIDGKYDATKRVLSSGEFGETPAEEPH